MISKERNLKRRGESPSSCGSFLLAASAFCGRCSGYEIRKKEQSRSGIKHAGQRDRRAAGVAVPDFDSPKKITPVPPVFLTLTGVPPESRFPILIARKRLLRYPRLFDPDRRAAGVAIPDFDSPKKITPVPPRLFDSELLILFLL